VTTWLTVPFEISLTYSPIGLRLLDEFTNEPPLGKTSAYLDIRDVNGAWHQTDIPATKTPNSIVSYPGLGRTSDVTSIASRHYRVRISAELYIPHYQSTKDGIEFDAPSYNDANPLPDPQIDHVPEDLFLTPAPNYPFQGHVPVLRGIVIDPTNKPVPNALVSQSNKERVVTDSRGIFALPLRWVPPNTATPIDAVDSRTGHLGTKPVTLPGDLAKNFTIPIS
jgi:hypothetical protein